MAGGGGGGRGRSMMSRVYSALTPNSRDKCVFLCSGPYDEAELSSRGSFLIAAWGRQTYYLELDRVKPKIVLTATTNAKYAGAEPVLSNNQGPQAAYWGWVITGKSNIRRVS